MVNDDTTQPDPKVQQVTRFAARPRAPGRPQRAPLDGRYRMLETLGRGGMGEVIAAHDEVLDRDVAIKRILDTDRPLALTRFLREAKIQSTLDHPAIPPVHELAHDHEGRPFFVMKRLTGTTLSKILQDQAAGGGQQFPRERLLNAFADVCLAIELAHTRGIIHRDLKPANIMLGDFGEVYVLDWGVAKVISDSDPALAKLRDGVRIATEAGVAVGTVGYMPPEQAQGLDLDARVDVYALGCVLYEILTGRRFTPLLRASQLAPARDIPPELDEACAAATALDRKHRLGSARALGATVQRYLDGDRDLVMRRRLAAEHLARATRAAAAMPADESQGAAMREAGRALALDPTLGGAADLVGRLMLEPPRTMPSEVAATLVDAERAATTKHTRIASLAYLMYAAFIPYLVWIGVREWTPVIAYSAILVVLLGAAWLRFRYPDHLVPAIVTVVANGAMIAMLGRMFSPYLIAPSVAALTIFILISSPKFRLRPLPSLMIIGMVLGTAGSGLLELAGVLEPTMTFANDHISIKSGVLDIRDVPLQLGLALYACGLVVSAAIIGCALGRANEDAQRRLHLQAWRLRQLVPQT